MKYEDLITNFTKLLYATQEETIKNITTKGIQETPDSISRGTEKKIIEEIQSRASDYIKENSNYRIIGLHNREKYQSEILPSIVEQIIKKLDGTLQQNINNPFLQHLVRKVELASIETELSLIAKAKEQNQNSKRESNYFMAGLSYNEQHLKGLREQLRIQDRIEKEKLQLQRQIQFPSMYEKDQSKPIEQQAHIEYLYAQLEYQTAWNYYNESILQQNLAKSLGISCSITKEELSTWKQNVQRLRETEAEKSRQYHEIASANESGFTPSTPGVQYQKLTNQA